VNTDNSAGSEEGERVDCTEENAKSSSKHQSYLVSVAQMNFSHRLNLYTKFLRM